MVEGFTPQSPKTRQPHNPIGLDLELPNQPQKVRPEGPRSVIPERSTYKSYPGPDQDSAGARACSKWSARIKTFSIGIRIQRILGRAFRGRFTSFRASLIGLYSWVYDPSMCGSGCGLVVERRPFSTLPRL